MKKVEKEVIFMGVASTIIGGFVGLALNSTALSPLVIGGIVSSVVPAFIMAPLAGYLLYQFCKKDPIAKGNKDFITFLGIVTLAGAAIGVGLAAAAIFPGKMLGRGPAFLTSAVIAGIAFTTATLAKDYIIMPIAKKVNEYIISPEVSECFPSQEGRTAS